MRLLLDHKKVLRTGNNFVNSARIQFSCMRQDARVAFYGTLDDAVVVL